jgi:hypothetical protein
MNSMMASAVPAAAAERAGSRNGSRAASRSPAAMLPSVEIWISSMCISHQS